MTDERLRGILAVMEMVGFGNVCPSWAGLRDYCNETLCTICWAKSIKEELDREIQG